MLKSSLTDLYTEANESSSQTQTTVAPQETLRTEDKPQPTYEQA